MESRYLKYVLSLLLVVVNAVDDIRKGMVSVHRGISPVDVAGEGEDDCNFVGSVTLGGPFSLSEADKFFNIGNKQLTTFQMHVDYINSYLCGVKVQGENYSIKLETYDDHSSKDWTNRIASHLVNRDDIDILMGGYSSGLTGGLADIADQSGKLLLAPGAASTSVFQDRPRAFGSFPPTAKYTAQAVEALAKTGAKSIASIWEDASFTRGVCAAIPGLAETYGMEVTSMSQVVASPNITVLEEVARNLTTEDPDVVMTCTYDTGCENWMKAMKAVDWSPRAQVFTVCVGLQKFVDNVGDDSTYIMGVTPWDQSLNIQDAVTGWSASDFAQKFKKVTGDVDVTYHAASAASVISIAVQAIEETNSTDSAILADYIANNTFKTAYGSVSFNKNGQSKAPSLLIQYDATGTVQTVFPEDVSSGPILYPMPTWAERLCTRDSRCIESGNECSKGGLCVCSNKEEESVGSGKTAQCIPQENMNYIPSSLQGVVTFYTVLTFLMATGCLFWTFYYRKNQLVKISQPLCLNLIAIGSILSISSLIPMGYETAYRDSDDVSSVDIACMAKPWLWGIGFTTTFSSLFAKVWRVKKVFGAATRFRRQQVGIETILWVMVPMMLINIVILIAFQVVSPQIWQREVLIKIDDYAIESQGQCESEHGWSFWLALVCFNILCLLYALVLCFQTKDIPSEFAESSHIFLAVMFMFQVLVLALPVCTMVKDQPDVFFFTMATAIFLQNFTALVIIFGPKIHRIIKNGDVSTAEVVRTLSIVNRRASLKSSGGASEPSTVDAHRRNSTPDSTLCIGNSVEMKHVDVSSTIDRASVEFAENDNEKASTNP